jgi:PIN domain nuclease of toxin-antitoxin system
MLISDPQPADSLLLDTHIWVWLSVQLDPPKFARRLYPHIDQAAADRRLYVCAASVWEIALKIQRGIVIIPGELNVWIKEQSRASGVQVLTLNSELLIDSTRLPTWIRTDGKEHKDPSDRFIVAAARRKNAVLITCDTAILDYARQGHLQACDARL